MMRGTSNWYNVQNEPKCVFVRAALSHLVRERLPELTHTDVISLLETFETRGLGMDVPRAWRMVRSPIPNSVLYSRKDR